ncbi:hypothetical protein A6X21_05850 [Planctopirus hydrillae]|uniref:Pseudouridine synthase RsuA/RluA-like domain-containing protein n=1 Tax=Planctopirus hydrillae TaxID=1841610 RepID=A0A1C3EBC2_9PLAN|nr:hypothetical protein A6X21_05850 [Planctopirus hydrillae]
MESPVPRPAPAPVPAPVVMPPVVVDSSLVGQTIVATLRKLLPDQSWSAVRKLIEQRRVLVNRYPCFDETRRLTERDRLEVLAHPAPAWPDENSIELLYVDEQIVVALKPEGMVTERRHDDLPDAPELRWRALTLDEAVTIRLMGGREATIAGRANPTSPGRPQSLPAGQRPVHRRDQLRRDSQRRDATGSPQKPRWHTPKAPPCHVRAAHRLDRQTSGLVVLSRVPEAGAKLYAQFQAHDVLREYEALVWGWIEPQRLESELIRDRGDGRRGSRQIANLIEAGAGESPPANQSPLGKMAATNLVASRQGHFKSGSGEPAPVSWIRCQLETGRTHQVRIHLSEKGNPIVGDDVYGTHSLDGIPRLYLHAARLGFTHPMTGQRLEFSSNWPGVDRKWLESHFGEKS